MAVMTFDKMCVLGETIILKYIINIWQKGMDWIYLAQDTHEWQSVVNTETKLRVP